MNNGLRWDDLRVALAVATAGSLSGAGRSLGLSHATVFRRLRDIEDRLGVRLFERSRTGYAPTTAGEEIVSAAQRIDGEVLAVERRVVGRDLQPRGVVRVTTTDTLLNGLLSPIFNGFVQTHEAIELEVAVSNDLYSLSRREADVAIRPSSGPPEMLLGRKLGLIAQAVYGPPGYKEVNGRGVDLSTAPWVGPDEDMAYRALEQWMAEQGLGAAVRYRINTVLGMFAAVRDGAGLAVLPCYLGEGVLNRLSPPIDELSTDLWLLSHPDLRKAARIRVFSRYIHDHMKTLQVRLQGHQQGPDHTHLPAV